MNTYHLKLLRFTSTQKMKKPIMWKTEREIVPTSMGSQT